MALNGIQGGSRIFKQRRGSNWQIKSVGVKQKNISYLGSALTQQAKKNYITFVQRRPSVEDIGPRLY